MDKQGLKDFIKDHQPDSWYDGLDCGCGWKEGDPMEGVPEPVEQWGRRDYMWHINGVIDQLD